MECKYKVKPLPYEFCGLCMLNGCYPWNRNPLLLCSQMGGVHIALTVTEDGQIVRCLSFKQVIEDIWSAHSRDLKREASLNEELRRKAMDGDVYCSELLPAEAVSEKTD